MIDPDNITLPVLNKQTSVVLKDVPEYDLMTFDLDSDKDLKKYLKYIEKEVRQSFEYREYIAYLKEYYHMDESGIEQISSRENKAIRIEIHHYPYTLYDIVGIVYQKRTYYQESLESEMVAKEVMMLHYKLLIGLIPLTTTEHELFHDGKIFYPADKILGRWDLFEKLYQQWIGSDLLDMTQRIRTYSDDNSELMKTTEILSPNHIHFEYTPNSQYQLPNPNQMGNFMQNRIQEIKQNNYRLPTLDDMKDINKKDTIQERRSIISPCFFFKQ